MSKKKTFSSLKLTLKSKCTTTKNPLFFDAIFETGSLLKIYLQKDMEGIKLEE